MRAPGRPPTTFKRTTPSGGPPTAALRGPSRSPACRQRASISGLVVDPDDPKTLYAATDSGVYRTRNSGASWFPLGQLLYGNAVGSLTLDSRSTERERPRPPRRGHLRSLSARDRSRRSRRRRGRRSKPRSLVSWDADSLTVQTLDDSGHESATPPEGPSSAWLATAISDGPDGLSRVLWVDGDGRAALEIVGPAGRQAVFQFAAVTNWSPADVSVAADGVANLLWRNQSDAMYLSRIDASGNVTLGPLVRSLLGLDAARPRRLLPQRLDLGPLARRGRPHERVLHRDLASWQEVFRFSASPGLVAEDITAGSDGQRATAPRRRRRNGRGLDAGRVRESLERPDSQPGRTAAPHRRGTGRLHAPALQRRLRRRGRSVSCIPTTLSTRRVDRTPGRRTPGRQHPSRRDPSSATGPARFPPSISSTAIPLPPRPARHSFERDR